MTAVMADEAAGTKEAAPQRVQAPSRASGTAGPALSGGWREIVERQPLLAIAGAAAVGVALGGIVFSRVGRLAFLAVAGYVTNELWHSERRIEIDELIAKLSSPPRPLGGQPCEAEPASASTATARR